MYKPNKRADNDLNIKNHIRDHMFQYFYGILKIMIQQVQKIQQNLFVNTICLLSEPFHTNGISINLYRVDLLQSIISRAKF